MALVTKSSSSPHVLHQGHTPCRPVWADANNGRTSLAGEAEQLPLVLSSPYHQEPGSGQRVVTCDPDVEAVLRAALAGCHVAATCA